MKEIRGTPPPSLTISSFLISGYTFAHLVFETNYIRSQTIVAWHSFNLVESKHCKLVTSMPFPTISVPEQFGNTGMIAKEFKQ